MTHGRNICNQLKAVRRRIAEENGIPLEIEECTFKGECRGTCPRCEAEVRYLENALANKLRLGKVATVAGIALGLATTGQAQAQETNTMPIQDTSKVHKAECTGVLKGTVFDIKTNELLPFFNVVLMQDGKQVMVGVTDFDGMYTIKPVPFGDYTLMFRGIGYRPFVQGVTVSKTGFTVMDVGLVASNDLDADSLTVTDKKVPVIEIGAPIDPSDPHTRYVRNKPVEAMGEIMVTLPGTPASESGDQPERIEKLVPMPGTEPQLIGGVGYQSIDGFRGGAVEAERVGPRIIVVEPEEPSL